MKKVLYVPQCDHEHSWTDIKSVKFYDSKGAETSVTTCMFGEEVPQGCRFAFKKEGPESYT